MIISKYGKSYDTSDGTEQQFGPEPGPHVDAGRSAEGRWEDDGGGPVVAVQRVIGPAGKPGWSVRSLSDLLAALRRTNDPADPEQARQAAQRAAHARLADARARDARAAEVARAVAHRDRNPWEHT